MKQYSGSVTLETSKASSVSFDQLDHAIEALSRCVCDVVPGVV
jgi:hypothetical protein